MSGNERNPVFDYRALRLLMGLIAFALPFVVTALATDEAVQATVDDNLLGADTRIARQELVKRQALR